MDVRRSSADRVITASTLQRQVGAVLRRVAIEKQRLIIKRDGFPIAVIMPIEDYGRLASENE